MWYDHSDSALIAKFPNSTDKLDVIEVHISDITLTGGGLQGHSRSEGGTGETKISEGRVELYLTLGQSLHLATSSCSKLEFYCCAKTNVSCLTVALQRRNNTNNMVIVNSKRRARGY